MNVPFKKIVHGDENAHYRRLVDSITDYAIYMLDVDGYVTSWNAGARRFKGYEAAEIIGRHFSTFYTEEDRISGLPKQALQTAAREGMFEKEGWRVRKDGTRFWAHVVIDPIRDHDGSIVGFAKITRDLTERQKAQHALTSSEDHFRLLVKGVTDYAIYMLDTSGHVASWNPGAQRIKGYSEAEIIGQHFSIFYTPTDREAGLPMKGLMIAASEGRFETESVRLRKDGSEFNAHVIIDAIRDDDGTLIGFAKVTRDVTERYRTQLALQKAQQTLFQTQKLESIGQLTGGVAHDFNNLLTAIGVCLELIERRLPSSDSRSKSLVRNAIEGVARGATLTQRMLAFARRQELKAEAISITKLINEMSDLLRHALGPNVTLQIDIPDDLPLARSDSNQLEAALLNLAINARDATPDGGVIWISAKSLRISPDDAIDLPPGPYVCISVADKGHGMDAHTLAKATEPFFTTKGVGKGSGLGLSMVHGLAEQSGGKLHIASEPQRGTTVDIILPFAGEETVHAEKNASHPPDEPISSARKETILIVDDDPLVLMGTAALVEELGFNVVEADSGLAALEIVAQRADIDLVFTDQAMPKMTGVQLAQAISVMRPTMPVILATGYAELEFSREAAFIKRISKPFGRAELSNVLRSVLGEKA